MDPGQKLSLPPLDVAPERADIARIHWRIRAATAGTVEGTEDIRVSPRCTERLLRLASGEAVIVTDRKSCPRPAGVDGVLRRDGGELVWASHRELDDLQARAARTGWPTIRASVEESWNGSFNFRQERRRADGSVLEKGLRPPQVGAVHAIAAHWSLFRDPATVVMPTGTGKTEAMLAAMIAFVRGPALVVVPTRALVRQTAEKFRTLGLLGELGTIASDTSHPIVGVLDHRPKDEQSWDFIDRCNVVVATVHMVAQGAARFFLKELAARCTHLFVDEAHHVAAETWSALRDAFQDKHVLQFTATPFRRDGQPVDGKVLYNYPLHRAQQDGYFRPIRFEPVFDLDPDGGDRQIASAALERLAADVADGKDHILMARCNTIERAKEVHGIYSELGSQHSPILVHSDEPATDAELRRLARRESRVVVCVDMLGEGYDLPNLKVAAVHDTHKSLAVLLQFIGRFTRSAGDNIGDATVIANIANQEVSTSLERLYSEDADWNNLLSEFSSKAISQHVAMVEFLSRCSRLDPPKQTSETFLISPKALLPKFSAVAFRCTSFAPKRFHEGLEDGAVVRAAWLNEETKVLFFITRTETRVQWSRAKGLLDRAWDLYLVYFNEAERLLFVHSTDRDSLHQSLADAVAGVAVAPITGDTVFRALGGISRLMFQNMGLKRHGRRNLRYSMYSGADVATALSASQTTNSTKSNVFGGGFERGQPVTVGVSYKGRLWSRQQGPIRTMLPWLDHIGRKLNDSSIDTAKIIENVLVPEEIHELPDLVVLCLDWPSELLDHREDHVLLISGDDERPVSEFSIELVSVDRTANEVRFRVLRQGASSTFVLSLDQSTGFAVRHTGGPGLAIQIGRMKQALEKWFGEYPPCILYMDGSELAGCDLIKPKVPSRQQLPHQQLDTWNWTGVDLTKESIWKDGAERKDSIQYRVVREEEATKPDVLFDDDGAGEAADVVSLREEDDAIVLRLLHCKFSGAKDAGERVKDVVEVCSQAIRSSKWIWRFDDLCRHLLTRNANVGREGMTTRFCQGDAQRLNKLVKARRFKPVRTEILIVQPGLSKANLTDDQAAVLNAAHSYLLETVDIGLRVICSP